MSKVLKSFKPLYRQDARYLVLGSMPGQASLTAQQYYAHPRNAFWAILAETELADVPVSYQQRQKLLFEREVALWDVLQYCQRDGSLDSAIKRSSEQVNDFAWLFSQLPKLKYILFNGQKAEQVFVRHVIKPALLDVSAYQLTLLPSTSPANAAMPLALKRAEWGCALAGNA